MYGMYDENPEEGLFTSSSYDEYSPNINDILGKINQKEFRELEREQNGLESTGALTNSQIGADSNFEISNSGSNSNSNVISSSIVTKEEENSQTDSTFNSEPSILDQKLIDKRDDGIRKKIKVAVCKFIKIIMNKALKRVYKEPKLEFQNFLQKEISNVSLRHNKVIMDMSTYDRYLFDSGDKDKSKLNDNKHVLETLREKHPYEFENDTFLWMKQKNLHKEFLKSKIWKNEKEKIKEIYQANKGYYQKFKEIGKNYVDYYTGNKPNKTRSNKKSNQNENGVESKAKIFKCI
jgi:hypothetical protein